MENCRNYVNEKYTTNRFGLFSVYIPLTLYLFTLIITSGLLKGFYIYLLTSPFTVGMIISIVNYTDNKNFTNLVKTIIISSGCVLFSLGIISFVI